MAYTLLGESIVDNGYRKLRVGIVFVCLVLGCIWWMVSDSHARQEWKYAESSTPRLRTNVADFKPDRPNIGILSLPIGDEFRRMHNLYIDVPGVIPSAYVKWLQSGGAEVVIIPHFWETNRIMDLVSKLSGVLFTGGDNGDDAWNTTTTLIYEEVLRRNGTDDPLALWGTCLGYERIMQVATEDNENTVVSAPLVDVSVPVDWDAHELSTKESKFLQFMGDSVLGDFSDNPIAHNFHTYGVTSDSWKVHQDILDPLFRVLGMMSSEKESFIAMIEGKDELPIWGVQFHPEKALFEWGPVLHYPHSETGVYANRKISDFFVQHVVSNFQSGKYRNGTISPRFQSFAEVSQYSAYNYLTVVPNTDNTDRPVLTYTETYIIDK